MKKSIIIVLILVLIILIGVIATKYYFSQKITSGPPEKEPPPKEEIKLPKTIYNLAGAIQKLEQNALLFGATINQLDQNGQLVQRIETRKAIITQTTKLTSLTFTETEPGRKTPKETPITFKDLKLGDYIEVISNRDISQAEEFEATQIRVLPH